MIDLKATYGDRYRITLDESARDEPNRAERLWLRRIPCRYGFIGVHGPDALAGFTDRRRIVARLIAIPGVRVHQRGDSEARVVFPPDCLDAVAELLRARRRRRLSEASRAVAAGRLKAFRLGRREAPAAP